MRGATVKVRVKVRVDPPTPGYGAASGGRWTEDGRRNQAAEVTTYRVKRHRTTHQRHEKQEEDGERRNRETEKDETGGPAVVPQWRDYGAVNGKR